jgi:hypothetical protein
VRGGERRLGRRPARGVHHPPGHRPGGAYRYDRVECEPVAVWSDFDRWAYERPLDVEDQPLRGDRYGGWTRIVPDPAPSGEPAPRPPYLVAGRDAGGFLAWPGKLP